MVTTWVGGEAESDVGSTARPTPCRERNSGSKVPASSQGQRLAAQGAGGGGVNWACFRGISWVVVVKTWVGGEAGSDAGSTAQVTTR